VLRIAKGLGWRKVIDMTDADWDLLSAWLLHGAGAMLAADELRALFADRVKVSELVRELRANRFAGARPHYSPTQ